uniref:Hyaluronan/mRNA-binding protein domain-containing protein n=1 Tax=Glossina brevipalpis TaxID=37001 RepID=A0A1A9X291_9MUSC
MDTSGNNRYELLFMDDDISDPLDNIVAKKKKQTKSTAASTISTGTASNQRTAIKQNAEATNKVNSNTANTSITNSKKLNQAEKENKPLNKNEGQKRTPTGIGALGDKPNKQPNTGGFGNGNAVGGSGGNFNRKRNNVDGREVGQGTQQQRNVNFRQQNGETREQRNNRRNTTRENVSSTPVGNSSGSMEGTTQMRQFKGGDRPPRNNRNFEGGNRKREFDRQSGSDKTGVKAVDKRDGTGAHNWGSVKDTIDEAYTKNNNEDNANNVSVQASGNTEKNEESNNEQQQNNDQANNVEEEVKELTLDEWKAQQQQRAKPQFNIRKAGEGEDTSQWKKMIVLNNNKKKENESEEELEYDPAMYPQRVGRQQRILDIQFNFNDGRRIGSGFGGRGRGGGRGGAGGGGGTAGPRSTGNNNNDNKPRTTGGGSGGGSSGAGAGANNLSAGGGGGGRGGKRQFADRHQQNLALKVNDERQFPTLA